MKKGNAGAWPNWRSSLLDAEDVERAWSRALERRGQPGSPETVHVYAHFAYCEMSCKFCMYYHRVPKEADLLEAYADYLARALSRRRANVGVVRATHAYCGGGTPSALPFSALERFFSAFSESVKVEGDFTFEAHPITLDADKVRLARRHGVNRISMGVQSLEPEVLRLVARKNPGLDRIAELTRVAQSQGILVNLDLLLGLPQQTPTSLRADVERLLDVRPDTITVYRYQPVSRLAVAPSEEMRFARVFDGATQWSFVRRGYVPAIPRDERAYGAKLWALSRRATRTALGQLARGAGRAVDAGAPAREYSCFSAPRSHVMGFGPGAFSHVFGEYWLYDCTSLEQVHEGRGPELRGSALDVADEWRTLWLSCLAEGRYADASLARRLDRVEARELLAALRTEPALEWRGESFRLRPSATTATTERVIARLLPDRPVVPEPEVTAETGRADDFCELVGIGEVGEHFDAEWQVVERTQRRVRFRSERNRHELHLVVDEAKDPVASFRVAHGMSIRYVGDQLGDDELRLLETLCTRLESHAGA